MTLTSEFAWVAQYGYIFCTIIAFFFARLAYVELRKIKEESLGLHAEMISNQLVDSPVLRKKQLLTGNEQEFYGRVKAAADSLGLRVHSQVSMGALVSPAVDPSHPNYHDIVRQFSMKIVDYVLEHKGQAVLVIELDDKLHDKAKDLRRDQMLFNAGISTLRYESTMKPTAGQIAADVRKICRML